MNGRQPEKLSKWNPMRDISAKRPRLNSETIFPFKYESETKPDERIYSVKRFKMIFTS